MPVLWVLGQRDAGDRPDVFATSAFDHDNRAAIAAIEGLRFVPLYAARALDRRASNVSSSVTSIGRR